MLDDIYSDLIVACENIKYKFNYKISEVELYNSIDSYKFAENVFNYYIDPHSDQLSVNKLIDKMASKISESVIEGGNAHLKNEVKSLLIDIHNRIFSWLFRHANDTEKSRLFLQKRSESGISEIIDRINQSHEEILDSVRQPTADDLRKVINRLISKNELFNYSKEKFDDSLFGYIEYENKDFKFLSEICYALPKVLFLVGDGGVGKTTHLKRFCKELADKKDFIPIFLSLFYKETSKSIIEEIVRRYPTDTETPLTKERLTSIFKESNSQYKFVIILDGLNEYKGNRNNLFIEINDLSACKNVYIIITSRYSCYDLYDVFPDMLSKITETRVKHVSEKQTCQYLKIESLPADCNDKAKDLLTTPFYISIVKHSELSFDGMTEINASTLMYEYMKRNIGRYTTGENRAVLEYIFPYICYIRYKEESRSEILGKQI